VDNNNFIHGIKSTFIRTQHVINIHKLDKAGKILNKDMQTNNETEFRMHHMQEILPTENNTFAYISGI